MHYLRSLFRETQSRLALYGTILEYYDYALYGFCASLLAQQLFPELSPDSALLQTYLIFCAGSLAKPIGACIFGYIGDLYGRAPALRWSMIGIALPTLIITVLPQGMDSQSAMFIVLGARILQGIFIAGESDGVQIRLFENHNRYPFLNNACVGLASYLGIFLASQGATLAKCYPDYWRLPFLVGGILGLILLQARRHITESPHFQRPHNLRDKPDALGLAATVLLCGAVGGTYHLFFVYQPNYWSAILSALSATQAQSIISLCLACYIPGLFIAAILSEKFRGEWVALTGILAAVALSPFLLMPPLENTPFLCGMSFALALMHSPGYVLLMRQFNISSRYRHLSIGHSLGSLLMSGTAPLLATYFWQKWHSPTSLVNHLIILLVLGFSGVILSTFKHFKIRSYDQNSSCSTLTKVSLK
ncbi:MFS transporter [Candidatus Odyssella thessalonicensis]|uniref:MFS transporter n=1 Tax=Candidatus Odyssella thessalonicensis TaxID=84647 RepID=UPI000225C0B1|nr:MFS transporter [Candidatus Odyssella thessalonicensis]